MSHPQKIGIGGDHAGFSHKSILTQKLAEAGWEVKDFGPFSEVSVDYPDFAHPLADAVANGFVDLGILICGSGNGVCITANKHDGIRAALAWLPEIAALARQHNDANVLCIPARYTSPELAWDILQAYLNASFEGGRHQNRVSKIPVQP